MDKFSYLGSSIEDIEIADISLEEAEIEALRSNQYNADIPATLIGEWPDPFDEVLGG